MKRVLLAILLALGFAMFMDVQTAGATDHAGRVWQKQLVFSNGKAVDTLVGANDSTTARMYFGGLYDAKVYVYYDVNQACTLYVREQRGPDSSIATAASTSYTLSLTGDGATACTLDTDYRMFSYHRLALVNKNAGNDTIIVKAYIVGDELIR